MNDDPAVCPPPDPCTHGVQGLCDLCPDPCVVATGPVAAIIGDFVSRWRQERPSIRGRRDYAVPADGSWDGEPVAPYTHLAHRSGLAVFHARRRGARFPRPQDVEKAEDDIRRARNAARNPTTELRVADAIVAAIGQPGAFGDDGPLRPMPNPKVAAGRHRECCNGSLTGAAELAAP